MVDLVHFKDDRVFHVVPVVFEVAVVPKRGDVGFASGEKIVQADDFVAFLGQPCAQMGAYKTSSSRHQDALGSCLYLIGHARRLFPIRIQTAFC